MRSLHTRRVRRHDAIVPQRVLVAEDDLDNRDALAAILRDHGFEVACASDGAEALVLARTFDPDVMLLDVVMPVMNGLELLASGGTGPHSRVVLMTAFSCDGERIRGLRVPSGVRVLAKPFEIAELLAALGGAPPAAHAP